jgi:hypothetical protein
VSEPTALAQALLADLDRFLEAADRRHTRVHIEVGEDRRWSAADTERLFTRLGRPAPAVPREQQLTDVLAEVVRLRNALQVWLDTPAELAD